MPDSANRLCPVCGTWWSSLYCGNDGAVTVLRSQSLPRAHVTLEQGALIDGRYRVVEVVGRGSFGVVYRAEQVATGQQVALKVMQAPPDERAVAGERFRKETRVLAQLRHPATVRVFDYGEVRGKEPYLVMELIDGPNLEQVLATRQSLGLTLTAAQAIDVLLPVLGSLSEAHQLGVVHRDLKPANIMMTQVPGEGLVIKVVDFGVVHTEGSDLTSKSSALGTPRYMSPEQCRGEAVDGRSDLYAVACVLFEMLTGAPPFFDEHPVRTVMMHVTEPPPRLSDRGVREPFVDIVIQRALEKTPSERFSTAAEMRQALSAVRSPLRAAPTTLPDLLVGALAAPATRHAADITTAAPRVGTGTGEAAGQVGARSAAAAATAIDVSHAAASRETRLDASPSQVPVKLPALRDIEAAIAMREAALAGRVPDEPARPPEAGGSGRARAAKSLGKRTIVGTGVPISGAIAPGPATDQGKIPEANKKRERS